MSEQPNPYNAKKAWHRPDKPSMGSADGLFFEPEATSEEAPQEEPSHDYKKRYDDLKKHYDQKILSQSNQHTSLRLLQYQKHFLSHPI